MERSKLSNIISTTRLLPHFSDVNINAIKSCIFEQLDITTESQFVAIALTSIYKTLPPESVAIIKNKAIEIADVQQIKSVTCRTLSFAKQNSNVTVCKYVEKQYDDRLSRLNSDIIDYFGTFLTKQESIEFGYLNKQLFIETQKQSYLLKRRKDSQFLLSDDKINKLYIGKTDAFNYTFPRHIWLSIRRVNKYITQNLAHFANFFKRLSILQCYGLVALSCVPFEVLFNKNSNYYTNKESREYIQLIKVVPYTQDDMTTVDTICQKFDQCKQDLKTNNSSSSNNIHNINSINNMRGIRTFEIDLGRMNNDYGFGMYDQEEEDKKNDPSLMAKRLLTRFSRLSNSIRLFDVSLKLTSIAEIQNIFHYNLKHVYFKDSSVDIDCPGLNNINNLDNMYNINNYINMNAVTRTIASIKIGMIEHMEFELGNSRRTSANNIMNSIELLNNLDIFSMRRNIRVYTLLWKQSHMQQDNMGHMTVNIGQNVGIFDKIFYQNYRYASTVHCFNMTNKNCQQQKHVTCKTYVSIKKYVTYKTMLTIFYQN